MSIDTNDDITTLSPSDAFSVLGNETRMEILQTLAEADDSLSFSELRGRVGVSDSGQFNYHLGKLEGHFVSQTGDGYRLRERGSIIVQAVLSGVLTETPRLMPTRLEAPCPYCGSTVEVSFGDERVLVRCTECPGTYAGSETDARALDAHPHGTIGVFRLPPAGLVDRSPRTVLKAALARTHAEYLAMSKGICPRCSANVAWSLQVCNSHDASKGFCEACNRRRALHVDYGCTNCTRIEENIPAGLHLVKEPELMSFISGHGINPVIPAWAESAVIFGYEEFLLEFEPLEARFTYSIYGEVLELTVNRDLEIVDITE